MSEEKFDLSLYNDEFFEWHQKHTIEYQTKTFQWYIDKFKPKSVVDFGCGIGTYLKTAFDNGIKELKGYDIGGEFAKKYTPAEVQQFIEYKDCTKPISFSHSISSQNPDFLKKVKNTSYDCIISFETAEHIDPEGTDVFINNIIAAAERIKSTILFTAAPPGQEGCGHINMHPKEFWIDKFFNQSFGFIKPDEELTKEISQAWKEIGCPDYIHSNLIALKIK